MTGRETILSVKDISKTRIDSFGVRNKILDNISFEINETSPKFLSILASFGGGKTTLFKILAGLEKPSSGDVILKGEKYLQPNGKIVLIPENSSSFPWLNVKENIELACRLENCGIKVGSSEINDLITLVGLTGYENHYPHNNSIGFRFRISLARALLFNPVVLLLDDCFKKMDKTTKDEIFKLLQFISGQVNTRFLFTTTNIIESVSLAGKILLLGNSRNLL